MKSILKLGLYTSILLSSITLSAQLTVTSGTSLIVTSSETVTILGDMDNAGNLTGKGTITVGGDFGNTGTLGIIIGPDETTHTTINVTGTSTLGGSFTVTNDAYTPSNGDEATIITSGSAIGSSFSNTDNNTWFANYNIPNSGDFTISYFGALPVELLYFTGRLNDDNIILNWETLTELNNFGFEIQKSNNARDWKKIGFVEGEGTSTESNQYQLIDIHPFSGLNYYRLKQIDFDGNFTYSKTIVIDRKNGTTPLAVFPNPTAGALYLNTSLKGTFIVSNILGQVLWQTTTIDALTQLDFSFLPAGSYLLTHLDGQKRLQTAKFVITKN